VNKTAASAARPHH